MESEELIATAAGWVEEAESIVVFTGAGVSTESGIPDFRSPGGIWDRYDPRDHTFQRFLESEKVREKYWMMHSDLYDMLKNVTPNPAHHACARLYKKGKLACVITQNVDNLHQRAGLPDEKVIELHGNALQVGCLNCKSRWTREEIQERLEAGEKAPYCTECGGILKPTTISFGQSMPEQEMREAQMHAQRCDLFIVIGSSLVVYPAATIPTYARGAGAKLVIINLSPTPYDSEADLLINGKAGEIMADILDRVR